MLKLKFNQNINIYQHKNTMVKFGELNKNQYTKVINTSTRYYIFKLYV